MQKKINKKRAIRRLWTKPFYAQRGQMGAFRCVLDEIHKVHYTEKLQINRGTFSPYRGSDDLETFLWCSPPMYLELLERVSPRVRKTTVVNEPIDLALKIPLTLHYLGTVMDYHSLQWVFHLAHNTIFGIDDSLIVMGCNCCYGNFVFCTDK